MTFQKHLLTLSLASVNLKGVKENEWVIIGVMQMKNMQKIINRFKLIKKGEKNKNQIDTKPMCIA